MRLESPLQTHLLIPAFAGQLVPRVFAAPGRGCVMKEKGLLCVGRVAVGVFVHME